MSIGLKFVKLTADVLGLFFIKYPPFAHYRLYALGSCFGKRVGVR